MKLVTCVDPSERDILLVCLFVLIVRLNQLPVKCDLILAE